MWSHLVRFQNLARSAFSIRAHLLCARGIWSGYRGHFFTYHFLYIVVCGERDFSPHLLFSAFDALDLMPSLLLLLSFDFLIDSSDGERAFSST
jgi:hypothetical protein